MALATAPAKSDFTHGFTNGELGAIQGAASSLRVEVSAVGVRDDAGDSRGHGNNSARFAGSANTERATDEV